MKETYSFRQKTIDEFIKELESKSAVPGGGGAAALCGAVGIALSSMVCRVTQSKAEFEGSEDEYEQMIRESEKLGDILLYEIDGDAEAFEFLMEAYRMPKTTAEEKKIRSLLIQDRLVCAIEAPLRTMHALCDTIMLFSRVQSKCSRQVISDVAVGVELCKAALKGSSMNVFINAMLMKNEQKRTSYITEAEYMITKYGAVADSVYADVKRSIIADS
ncbi:MAG: cyclodeaminase/cyclohydrolase family protein [Clostridia bacterium]|nr:cyclodeaminase/cyclohydrolase family protein [Clostridia bacterium]